MLKKIMMASLAVGALAFNAPGALADDPPEFGCNFRSVHQEDATGQNFEGAAWGYVVHAEGGNVSIRCEIRVNGSPASTTPTGTGTDGAATTSGRVTFQAGDTDIVTLVAYYTTEHGSGSRVYPTAVTQVPPQEVIDLINDVVIEYVDPALCDILKLLAGTYGPVFINEQGDVYVNGAPEWDCPPYDIWPPA